MSITLTGTALCVKYQMRQFIAQGGGGSIVNIASINAFKPASNMPAYTSAKHALVGLTKHASMEGGPHNIRVNAVPTGAIFVIYTRQLSTSLLFDDLLTSFRLTDCNGRAGAKNSEDYA